jgi:hypothetical protein
MLKEWYETFRRVISQRRYALPLREATMERRLGDWTQFLTRAVAETCRSFGWMIAAKGEEDETLPVRREEYLGIDVIAFEGQSPQWRLPVAVFELENRTEEESIAYSLWKVNAVRCRLRGVFCYQENSEEIGNFIKTLREAVMPMIEPERIPLLLVVGTRGKAEIFPDGFFQPWYWDYDWRAFRKLI